MRLPFRSTDGAAATDTYQVRVDASTKTLTKRLREGEVAIIDHVDLDRVSAEALVAKGPSAVLTAAKSTSGRAPDLGPGILVESGIHRIAVLGSQIMAIPEGSAGRVDGATVYSPEGSAIAEGVEQTAESVELEVAAAREGL